MVQFWTDDTWSELCAAKARAAGHVGI